MTVWQEPVLSRGTSRSTQLDLESQLEASHAEVAQMRNQISAATAAVASARGSPIPKKHYPALGDADYSEDSLIRCDVRTRLRKIVRVLRSCDQTQSSWSLASPCCIMSSVRGPDTSATVCRQLTDEMNLELEQRRTEYEKRSRQLEDQSRYTNGPHSDASTNLAQT